MDAKYKRCLLKISGESLAGPAGSGFDAETINAIAAQVAEISRLGSSWAWWWAAAISGAACPRRKKA